MEDLLLLLLSLLFKVSFLGEDFYKIDQPLRQKANRKLLKLNIGVWISLPWLTFIGFNTSSKMKALLSGWLNLYIAMSSTDSKVTTSYTPHLI